LLVVHDDDDDMVNISIIIITVYLGRKSSLYVISAAVLETQVEWERVFGVVVVDALKAVVYMKKMMIIFSFLCMCSSFSS